jgi:hypothetical protein
VYAGNKGRRCPAVLLESWADACRGAALLAGGEVFVLAGFVDAIACLCAADAELARELGLWVADADQAERDVALGEFGEVLVADRGGGSWRGGDAVEQCSLLLRH